MTIRLEEYPDSQSATADRQSQTRTLHFWLSGEQDAAIARAYATDNTPSLYDGYFRQGMDMDTKGGGLWDIEAYYGSVPKNESGDVSFTFDTSGGTAHITQAKEHIASHTAAGVLADTHNGAIGVTDTGVDGTDVVIAQFSWTENWTLPISYASFSAAVLFKNLTGKVNASAFRGFGAGQVRFDGATGGASTKEKGEATLSYKFVQSDDSSDAMPAFKSGITKLGWYYLWAEYEKQEGATDKVIIRPPVRVHVDRVYDAADFSSLGIGTGLL